MRKAGMVLAFVFAVIVQARVGCMFVVDTVPPHISAVFPAPDSVINLPRLVFGAEAEDNLSGIWLE